MSDITLITCSDGTSNSYHTVPSNAVSLLLDGYKLYYENLVPDRQVIEVYVAAGNGKGTITADKEIQGKISAATLYTADLATGAVFGVQDKKLSLYVPLDGGEVGWDFSPSASTVSLKLKVRVKNLTP